MSKMCASPRTRRAPAEGILHCRSVDASKMGSEAAGAAGSVVVEDGKKNEIGASSSSSPSSPDSPCSLEMDAKTVSNIYRAMSLSQMPIMDRILEEEVCRASPPPPPPQQRQQQPANKTEAASSDQHQQQQQQERNQIKLEQRRPPPLLIPPVEQLSPLISPLDPNAREFTPSPSPSHVFGLPISPGFFSPTTPAHHWQALLGQQQQQQPQAGSSFLASREHWSRALLVSGVPTEASDTQVMEELERWGPVRAFFLGGRPEGLVTVHYFDVRHAKIALTDIQAQHVLQQRRMVSALLKKKEQQAVGAPRPYEPVKHELGNVGIIVSSSDDDEKKQNGGIQQQQQEATMIIQNGLVHAGAAANVVLEEPAELRAGKGLIGGAVVWAQFCIPSVLGGPDGNNQGTLVIFNLDSNMPQEQLRALFEIYGDVREVREAHSKKSNKFVEFFDIRDAKSAKESLDGTEIGGKRVKIEFSRPGGQSRHGRLQLQGQFYYAPPGAPYYAGAPLYDPSSPIAAAAAAPPWTPAAGYYTPMNTSYSSQEQQQQQQWCYYPSLPSPPPLPPRRGAPRTRPVYRPKNNSNADSGTRIAPMPVRGRLPCTRSSQFLVGNSSPRAGYISPYNYCFARYQKNNRCNPRKRDYDESEYVFNVKEAEEASLKSGRTTLMIRNIPNKYSQQMLLQLLDQHCLRSNEEITDPSEPLSAYDFLYLPIDFRNRCNLGYAFVNLTTVNATIRLYDAFNNHRWEAFKSRKVCQVTYARVQGRPALEDHFRNSRFICDTDDYLPLVFNPARTGINCAPPIQVAGHLAERTPRLRSPPRSRSPLAPVTPELEECEGVKTASSSDSDEEKQQPSSTEQEVEEEQEPGCTEQEGEEPDDDGDNRAADAVTNPSQS